MSSLFISDIHNYILLVPVFRGLWTYNNYAAGFSIIGFIHRHLLLNHICDIHCSVNLYTHPAYMTLVYMYVRIYVHSMIVNTVSVVQYIHASS